MKQGPFYERRYFLVLFALLYLPFVVTAQEVEDRDPSGEISDAVIDGTGAGRSWQPMPDWFPANIARKAGSIQPGSQLVDARSAAWRTGRIDPRIAEVPASLTQKIKQNPQDGARELVAFLAKGSADKFQTVKRFHDWITASISYDSDKFCGRSSGTSEPYELLATGRTTCGGFSNVFKLFCDIAGIECQYISGDSRSYLSGPGLADHAWNAVRIDGIWYIVDTTHDSRRSYEYGTFGEQRDYRDTWLFVTPRAKLQSNRASKEELQLMTSPMGLDDFLSQPFVQQSAFQEGLMFDFGGLGGRFIKVAVPRENSGLSYIRDWWFPEGRAGFFTATVPPGLVMRTTIKAMGTGTVFPLAAAVHHTEVPGRTVDGPDRTAVRVDLTPPGSGEFLVTISVGRPAPGKSASYRSVYVFTMYQAGPPAGAIAFESGRFYFSTAARVYGLPAMAPRVSSLKILPSDPAWLTVDFPDTDGYEIYASLTDRKNQPTGATFVTGYPRTGVKRYFIRMLPGEPGLMKVYIKKTGEDRYYNYFLTALIPPGPAVDESGTAAGTETGETPFGVPVVYRRFSVEGFAMMDEPILEPDGIWSFSVSGPLRNTLRAGLRDATGKDVALATQILRTAGDKRALVRIAPPPGEGSYTARLYKRESGGTINTVLTIRLKGASGTVEKPSERLWQPGRIYEHPDVLPGIATARAEEPAGAIASVALQWAKEYEATWSVYEPDGTRLDSEALKTAATSSYPAPLSRTWYFTRGQGRVVFFYLRPKGTQESAYAWSIRLPADHEASGGESRQWPELGEGQITWAPQCSTLFGESGLVLVDWQIDDGTASVRFRGPQNLNPVVYLRTEGGKAAAGTAAASWESGIWTARYSWPATTQPGTAVQDAESFFGRVYLRGGGTSLRTIVNFRLAP